MRILISTTMLLVFVSVAAAAESLAPPVGTTTTYECTGPGAKDRTWKLVSDDNGKMRWEFTHDGKQGYAVFQRGLWGSLLNYERDNGDGKGRRTMEWDAADVAGYDPLTPGSSMEVDVKTVTRDWQANEEIKVRVAERGPMTVGPMGDVEAVKIVNSRYMRGLFSRWNYESSMELWVDVKTSVAFKWTYKDNKGTQDCNLTDVQLGS